MATTKRLPGFEFLGQPDIDMTGSIITNGSCAELCVRGFLSVAAPRLVPLIFLCFLGLTPQAIHLSPLRGSDRASEGTCREYGAYALKRVMLAMERRRRDRYLARGVSPGVGESNSERAPGGGGRYIAWGVSPRYKQTKLRMSPWRGLQIITFGRNPLREKEIEMSDTYANLTVHLVFATKDRMPLMTRNVREHVFPYIGGVVKGQGCTTIAVGGMPDHIHIVTRLPTNLCVADFVRTVKANSSKKMNEHATSMKFGWQRGYGAFSVSQSALSAVVQYVRNQDQHHCHRSFSEELMMLLTKHGIDYDERYLH